MTGYTGNNGSTTNVLPNSNVNSNVNSIAVSTIQGATAQSWAGVTAATNNSSLGNSSFVRAPGNPNPEDKTPGNLAVGQPGGANVAVIQNVDGAGASGNPGANLMVNLQPAGTAGGGNAPQPVSNAGGGGITGRSFGWTVQNLVGGLNEDGQDISIAVLPQYTAVHSANTSAIFTPTISGGTSPYTVTCVECVQTVAGVQTTLSGLPATLTLTASTGAVANSVTSAAGTYQLGFRVSDSSSPTPTEFGEYEVTVVLT